ncbi:MAG: hypothetical protein FJ087_07585 [Deltaproteobacteria bacterium]|nr:hypothetical protein [Deltaproteobacteria bacterium]
MPGMDGIGFVRTTREDPDLRGVPAIVVSSRGSDEDRRRGAEAGARARITETWFSEQRFLQVVRELAG